jgi:hypothetical protein
MNEVLNNAQNINFSDVQRFVVMALSLYCLAGFWAGHRRVMSRAGDRLKNFYYAMICTAFTFGVGSLEGWLRNRAENYSLWLMILVLLFMSTALHTGSPLEFFKRGSGSEEDWEVDSGFNRGFQQGYKQGRLGKHHPDA